MSHRHSVHFISVVSLVAIAALFATREVAALETDILLGGAAVKPNVLLLFDNSGSMNNAAAYSASYTYTGPYNAATIYSRCRQYYNNCTCRRTRRSWEVHDGECGFTDNDGDGVDDLTSYKQIGNRLNYEAGSPNKIQIAKSVITSLLRDPAVADVRFGLMVYNGNIDINNTNFSQSAFMSWHTDSTVLKSQVQDDNQQNLIGIVNGLNANGGTPSAPRMINAGKYFEGTFPGKSSPVQVPCQRNYIVNITDGKPEGDGNSLSANYTGQYPYVESWLHAKLGSDIDPDDDSNEPDPGNDYINGGSDYMDDVAWVLQHQDLLPAMDGLQNVTTFTIGYDIDHQLLQDTADNGGGKHFTATSSDELADALRRTLNLIVTDAQSFVAPVVPVNALKRTQSGDRLYIALFQPLRNSNFWAGNIKKYGIDSSGDLTSPNGQPATSTDGSILPTASSYYDTSPSGGGVTRGGVGEILHNRTSARNIYTYLGGSTDLTSSANAFKVSNTSITKTTLSVPDTTTRDEVIRYVTGEDVFDDDEDENYTEKRDWILGDFVHSTPLIVTYGTSDRVIIAGANDGQLHAFDDATGDELWSFVPPSILPQLKKLLPGETAAHPFLVDGSPKLLVTDNDQYVVVFGLRRGGAAYYALDVTSKTSPQFLWQVTDSTSGMSELGETWSSPVLGKMGTATSFDYVAIFGGGYDTFYDDAAAAGPNTTNPVGRGYFIVNALTGSLMYAVKPAGLQYPVPTNFAALDINQDDTFDLAYFGDLGGNLWRVELPNTATKVFSTPGHKIFYAPDLVRDQGYLDVFFGTGDLVNPLETTTTERLYAFRDDGLTSGYTEANLVDVTDNLAQDGSTAQQDLIKSQLASSKGWFIRLTTPGEKALASPLVFFDVFFTTFVPTEEVCDGGGDALLYVLGFEDGRAAADLNEDGTLEESDRRLDIGSSIPTEVTPTIRENDAIGYVGVGGGIPRINLPGPPLNLIPIYWREIF